MWALETRYRRGSDALGDAESETRRTEKRTRAALRAIVIVLSVIAEVRFVSSDPAMLTRKPATHEPRNMPG